jgi:hypothetical protein
MKTVRTVITALAPIVLSSPAFAQTDNSQAAAQGIGILSWIVIGLIAGYLASRVVNKTGEGLFRDIILGIVGPDVWRYRRYRIKHLEHLCRFYRCCIAVSRLPRDTRPKKNDLNVFADATHACGFKGQPT